jgi:hypothetical protein
MADGEMIEFVLPLAEVTKQWGELTMQLGARRGESRRDRRGLGRLPVLFRLRRAGLLVGALGGAAESARTPRMLQARQARDGARFISRASCRGSMGMRRR